MGFYERLESKKEDNIKTIRSKYLALIIKHKSNETKISRLKAAWATIGDREFRKYYDQHQEHGLTKYMEKISKQRRNQLKKQLEQRQKQHEEESKKSDESVINLFKNRAERARKEEIDAVVQENVRLKKQLAEQEQRAAELETKKNKEFEEMKANLQNKIEQLQRAAYLEKRKNKELEETNANLQNSIQQLQRAAEMDLDKSTESLAVNTNENSFTGSKAKRSNRAMSRHQKATKISLSNSNDGEFEESNANLHHSKSKKNRFQSSLSLRSSTKTSPLVAPDVRRSGRPVSQHRCKICGKTFATACNLRRHHREEHVRKNPQQFRCEKCGKTNFKNERIYKNHKDSCGRKFVCGICGSKIATKFYLQRHLEAHTEKNVKEEVS